MNRISKKLALFCAVLLINPLVSTAKPGFAAQNNGDRVSEYVKEADKKLNSADIDAEKNEDKPKELRLIIELDKDSLIEEAINKLPPRCREIFIMCKIQKKTQIEVAQSLGLSHNTIETQMGIAYKKLRVLLQDILPFVILFGVFDGIIKILK